MSPETVPGVQEIRELARDFAGREIAPHAAEWDAARALDPSIFRKLAELGFLGMLAPEEHGGLDLPFPVFLVVLEEIARADASVALSVGIHGGPVTFLLRRYGSPGQKRRYLPRLAEGELLGAFALSEPEAGSDARALTTTARPRGDGWVVSGTKKWVTNGDRAGLVVLFARTVEGEDDGISAFLVERETPGYRVGRRERTMGLSASETVEVHLEDVALPADALLGEAGQGFRYAMEALDLGRVGVAALALGVAGAAADHALGYALERVQFGRALVDFQATRFKLAEMERRLTEVRLLVREAGARADAVLRGEGRGGSGAGSLRVLAALAKVSASEAAVWIADEAVQVFGGYGYMRHYPVEKLLRDAKGSEIFEGANEILRLVVARELLRTARSEV